MRKISILLIFALSLLTACDKENQVIGKWDDQIKLSSKSATLIANTDSAFFSTQGSGWWFSDVQSADSTYYGVDENFDNIYLFQEEFFTIKKQEEGLFVKFSKNESGKQRSISITLQAGNYFDYVYVNQNAE